MGPTQGAAQTANAAPRNTEPAAASGVDEPGRKHALRNRQEAQEGEPEHDHDQSRDLCSAVRRQKAPERGGAGPERHEHDCEADEEGDARHEDSPGDPRLAETVRLDGGDGGEVAGNERQHAWRDDRDEAGGEREEDAPGGHAT